MANSDDKPDAYEAIGVTLWAPGVPLPAQEELSGKRRWVNGRPVLIAGMTTPMMSVAQAVLETARLLEHYQKKVRKDVWAVLELMDIQPAFVRVGWVGKAFERLMKVERAKRKRGRPKGTYKVNPAVVLGFVRALQASGRAKSEHHAVLLLFRRGIFTYHQTLHGLRIAKKEPRLRPLLLPSAGDAQVSASEAAELLRRAITPKAGETLHYRPSPDRVLRLFKITTENGQERLYYSEPSSPDGSGH